MSSKRPLEEYDGPAAKNPRPSPPLLELLFQLPDVIVEHVLSFVKKRKKSRKRQRGRRGRKDGWAALGPPITSSYHVKERLGPKKTKRGKR